MVQVATAGQPPPAGDEHGMGPPCTFVETVREAAIHNSRVLAAKAAQEKGVATGEEGEGEGDVGPHLGVLHRAAQRHAEEQKKVRSCNSLSCRKLETRQKPEKKQTGRS